MKKPWLSGQGGNKIDILEKIQGSGGLGETNKEEYWTPRAQFHRFDL